MRGGGGLVQVGRRLQGCAHTLHTGTLGAVNVGGERTVKGRYGPHILAVLRMADSYGQVGARVKRPLPCSDSTRVSHRMDIQS